MYVDVSVAVSALVLNNSWYYMMGVKLDRLHIPNPSNNHE